MVVTSGEAYFHLIVDFNKQNCRYWADENLRQLDEKPLHKLRLDFGV